MSAVPLHMRNELAGGARLGGQRGGSAEDIAANCSLWKGRPPRLESGFGPDGFMVGAKVEAPADPGSTVLCEIEAGNSWGGITRRQFNVGAGISADLRLGVFEHVVVRTVFDPLRNAPGIPAGVTVYFSWTWNLMGRGDLLLFQLIPAGTVLQAPEGAESLIPESACTLTWQAPAYGTTFVQSAIGGQELPAAFPSAFSCNVANKFVWRLRGI